jgi:putative endonuclease
MYVNFETRGYVYILASQMAGTIYIGVTSDLVRRISEHLNGTASQFTARYKVHRLVHWQEFGSIEKAIKREKQLKNWRREWKIRLIEESNPKWDDLYPGIVSRNCMSGLKNNLTGS